MAYMFKSIIVISLFSLFACSAEPSSTIQAPTENDQSDPVTVFVNGDIVTMDGQNSTAPAVAVQGGTILKVGSESQVLAAAGNNSIIRDLQGATLMPSFIDAHGHISLTMTTLASANLSSPPVGEVKSVDDIVAVLRDFQQQNPQSPLIFGWGYDDSLLDQQRHPTRFDLDKVSTSVPVVALHVSGHLLSCNSRCLELVAIDDETANPPGGVIRRVPGRLTPNGVLEESAILQVIDILPKPDEGVRIALLERAQQYYASYGVTTVQDGAASGDDIDLLIKAALKDKLYLDVVAYPLAPTMGDRLPDYGPSSSYNKGFRIGGIKLVLDGSPQGKTAWLSEPYFHPPHGKPTDYVGYPILSDQAVAEFVDYAFRNQVQLMAHANGDAAADQLIAAIAAGNAQYGRLDRRTVMIHAQTVRDNQIDSMLAQGIMPSYFSAHTFYWGDWHRDSVFGLERASRISPLRSSTDRGLRYSTHNDTPIVPSDMMRLLWASVNRRTRSGEVLGKSQQATVMEALRSITIDAAYQYFEEHSKGSIEVGKRADLVILDKNPLNVPPLTIKDIQVLETIKDGKTVFSR